MERLIKYFVDRHMLVHVLVVIIVTLGIVQSSRAPRETFPSVTLPTLFVRSALPGAAARDVETKLAIPTQEVVEELDGLRSFNSIIEGASASTEVELNEDFDAARVREAERDLRVLLDGVRDFPPEMEDDPIIERFNPDLFPVVQIALAGPSGAVRSAGKLLERKLRGLPETSRVTLVGLPDPELRILVDPVRARESGVTLPEIVDAIRRRNVSATGGMLESERDRRQVVLWSRYTEPEQISQTILRFEPDGSALSVGDVARVELAREDTNLITHTNGQPGVTVVIRKQQNEDIVNTVAAIRTAVAATPLPEGVTYAFVRDESFMARNRLQLMWNNGAVGAALVAVVLFVFLTPIAAFWTLVGIPVIFLGTLALFPVFGFAINMVTLTGLVVVLGMVVDDAIVVSERIVARRQAGEERHMAAINGAAEMARPVAASALTTVLAFMPLWGLGGMNGRMVEAMPSVIILALCLSVFESFTILPAHMSLGTKRGEGAKRKFVVRMEQVYRGLLVRTLRHRGLVVAGFAAALVLVFFVLAPRMGVMLYPQDDAEAAFAKVTLPLGTPIERTEAVVASVERQISEMVGDDLIAVTARIGHQDPQAIDRTRGAAENEAIVTAVLQPSGRSTTAAEWLATFEEELQLPPDAQVIYEAEYMGPPVGNPVTLHVASNEDDVRRGSALELAEWIGNVPGVVNVDIDERPGTPQVELALDYERLALRGLDSQEVARTIQIAFQGMIASEHRDLEETTDFRVMLEPSARRSLDALLELPVRGRGGELVLLRDVVTPIEVPSVSRIYHRDGRRTATVSAGFAPGAPHTALSFATLLETEVFPRYAGTPGLELAIGGEAKETRKTTGDMGLAALMAVAGIALVIALMLGSFLEAIFVVAIIPFSVAGVILAFFFHGQPLSIFAMMGAIGLAGVVVNASIVMVDAVHRAVKFAGPDPDARRNALLDAIVGRLRPIVVTTLTTLGGVMPMAYGLGGHDAVVAPMSLAIGWGLALSTSVTLFLVPSLYTLANDLRGVSIGGLRALLPGRDRAPGGAGIAAPDAGLP